MEIIIINVIIPSCISIIIAYFTARATYYFKEKEHRKKFVISKNYDTFVNLRNNLKDFFTDVAEKYDFWGYLTKNKKSLKDMENRLKTNFTEYTKREEKEGISCVYNAVSKGVLYLDYIEKFEKIFLDDISEIAKLSHPDIKKITTKIENIYITTKKEECLLFESLQDELGERVLEDKYSGYMEFKKCAYWGQCWLQILPLLKKLQNNLDEAVNLEKV